MRTAARTTPAIFDVAKGTAAFVAASVAKTGDMKITTPTATLGIRGTTGLVEVPEGAAANNPNNVAIKLYPDADGRVGRIEVNDRAGARLGFLTQGASGFTIRPGAGGVALRRGAAGDSASGDAARPGLCAAAPLDAEYRTPDRVPAARIPPRQSQLRQSEPSDPAIAARPDQAEWFARTSQARTTAARSAKSSRTAAATAGDRPGQQQLPGAPNRQGQQQPGSPTATGYAAARRTAAAGSPNQPGMPPRAGQPPRPDLPRSPVCRPAQANRNSRTVPAQPAAPQGRPGLNRFGAPGLHGRRVYRVRLPCSVRDRPRRGGRRSRRNAASRRRRSAGSARTRDQVARRSQSPHLLHEASRLTLEFPDRFERDAGSAARRVGHVGLRTTSRRGQRDRPDSFEKRALIAARQPLDGVARAAASRPPSRRASIRAPARRPLPCASSARPWSAPRDS